ncbi:MAG: LuxR C-terminal-related transcriptional regulator [Oribacterium sp.]|nr:LuxR C-terminal-related transcriptional regulator [Oribacterium sp.]
MNYEQNNGQKNFFLEMENHQISAQEFFCPFMLEALERNFGLDKVIIMYFDTHGHFLSMTDKDGPLNDDETSGVHNRTIKNYIYTIHDYPKSYSNGIVDMYHWITIHKKEVSDMTLEDNASVSTVATAYLKELTKTEHKVASFMAKGYTYKEIAAEMMISYHTVKKHVENIYEKCHVNSRYQLIKLFSKRNIG